MDQDYTTKQGSKNAKTGRPARPARGSADAVRDEMRRKVGAKVAAVAGVVEGFNEQMEENDVPGATRKAIEQTGE
ncbi:MAG: hypothetical protein ABR562_08940, partial [Thermoplasmatota archaeon]